MTDMPIRKQNPGLLVIDCVPPRNIYRMGSILKGDVKILLPTPIHDTYWDMFALWTRRGIICLISGRV